MQEKKAFSYIDTQVTRRLESFGTSKHCQYFCRGTNKVFTLKYLLLKPPKIALIVVLTINYLTFQRFFLPQKLLSLWHGNVETQFTLTPRNRLCEQNGFVVILFIHKLIIAEIFSNDIGVLALFIIIFWVIVVLWFILCCFISIFSHQKHFCFDNKNGRKRMRKRKVF